MTLSVIVTVVAVLLVAAAIWRIARAALKFHGRAVVTCPETHQPAGVEMDSRHAAATALGGSPDLRLSACSRWPERAGCGQECLAEIHARPEDCLVRNILVQWYAGKSCVSCGHAIDQIDWVSAKPGLIAGDAAKGWNEVPAERLKETLESAAPLCFACYTAARLMQDRPDLILDRGRHA
jgi:hypothetical protein